MQAPEEEILSATREPCRLTAPVAAVAVPTQEMVVPVAELVPLSCLVVAQTPM